MKQFEVIWTENAEFDLELITDLTHKGTKVA